MFHVAMIHMMDDVGLEISADGVQTIKHRAKRNYGRFPPKSVMTRKLLQRTSILDRAKLIDDDGSYSLSNNQSYIAPFGVLQEDHKQLNNQK